MEKTDDIWPGLYDYSKGQYVTEVRKEVLATLEWHA
jgi:hypothetical protein